MVSSSALTARFVIGVIGNVISGFLFLSPIPTFFKIWKAKSVQSFKPHPYVVTILNCAMWVFYGLPNVHPGNILVVTINGAGIVIQAIYVGLFIIFSNWGKRRTIFILLLVEAVFFAIIVLVTMLCFHTTSKRSMVVGVVAIVLNIAMYTSPLTVMKMVIKTKSVKYMPFYLSLANLLNGAVWTVYACIRIDPFLLIPNGLGALSGVVQIVLYWKYYGTTNWDEDDNNNDKAASGAHDGIQLSDKV